MTIAQLDSVFQIAYATNDLDKAMRLFRDRFGTGRFTMLDVPADVMRIGLAYAGRMMIELIQPVNDGGLYSNWIAGTEGFALRHHHFGILADSKAQLTAIRQAHIDAGTTIATEGSMPGALDFLYVDTTADLGHYLEYVRLDPAGVAIFAQIEDSLFKAE